MLLRIQHETKLRYSDSVAETVFEVRMSPQSDDDQTNLGYRLRINPPAPVTSFRDGFGNRVDMFNIMTPYRELAIQTSTLMRTHRRFGEARLAEADLSGDGASGPAAASGCPRATSGATSAGPASWPPTPGARSGGAASAGSTSTRPAADSPMTTTSSPPSAATSPTSPPTEGSGKGRPTRSS